jgi:hypothetical protein
MTSLTRLFQAVSKQSETDKPLITLPKLPAVSLFQRFWGMLPVNFLKGPGSRLKFARTYPPEP